LTDRPSIIGPTFRAKANPPQSQAARDEGSFSERPAIGGSDFRPSAALFAPLVVCSLALFWRALFGGEAFYARDVLHYYWPMRSAAAGFIHNLVLPQWSPFAQSGLPFLADIHTGVLYPPHALYQFVSFPRAYAWLLVLHHLAAGLGALVFFRQLGVGRIAALSAALVYMLSGYIVGLNNAGSLMAGAAYVPWVLAALSSRLHLRLKIVFIALLVAMQALTGDPQSVLFSVLGSTALVAWQMRSKPAALAAVAGLALAGLLAAAQLIPAWHLLSQSNRASVDGRFFEQFALHPVRLLELFAPFPLGGYLAKHPFWAAFAVKGPGIWPFALSAYVGAAAATAVLIGARWNARTGFGVTLLVLGVLLALGPHGPLGPVLLLPPFRFFRYPEKYLLVVSLGMATLVSQAIDSLQERQIGARRLIAVGAAIGTLVATVALAHVFRLNFEQALGGFLRRATPRVQSQTAAATLLESARWALSCAGAVWLLGLLTARSVAASRITVPGIGVFIALDLLFAGQALVFTAPIEMFQTRPAIVDELNRLARVHPYRYQRDWTEARTFDRDSEESYLRLRAWELETLKSNLGGAFGLEEVAGYAGGFSLGRWEAVAVALYDSRARLGALFNGCLALSTILDNPYQRDGHFKRVAFDSRSGLIIYENNLCQPRLRAVSKVIPVDGLEAAIQAVSAPEFDVASEAAVEGAVEHPRGLGQIGDVEIQAARAKANVTASAGGTFVVFATSYYPGWAARLDGAPVPLKIANGATMGIEVPEGRHSVEFEFRDPGARLGFALSLMGIVLVVGVAVFGKRCSTVETKGRDKRSP
jgi:hypothetical protein